MEVFLGQCIEYFGIQDELAPEGSVKLGMVGPIVCPGDVLDVAAGVFMRQNETVADIFSSVVGAFAFYERGNLKDMLGRFVYFRWHHP